VNGRPEAKQKLERLVAEAIADAASIRVHRSKYIAHLDHAVAVDETEALLPPVAQADVERVLSRMADAYRAFWLDIRDIDYSLTLVVHSGGAKALVQVLEGSEWWAQVKAGNARSRAFQRRRDARSGTSVTK
jgi:membrane glycosyltransferase